MSEELPETTTTANMMMTVEKDVSFPRTITMPLLLYRLCKKYDISVSEATQEGALMLLRMNDSFMDSNENLEKIYRQQPGRYKEKTDRFISVIQKLNGGQ